MTLKLCVAGLIAVGAFFAGQGTSGPQDEKDAAAKKKQEMEAYMKAATPGAEHQTLATLVGKWEETGTFTDGKPMDMPFTAMAILGYDNVTKQFQEAWLDSMGTGLYTLAGKADASGKKITMEGIAKDVKTPEGRPWKFVMDLSNADKVTTEMWDTHKGAMIKVGTITSVRKK
jgi:hypothetical protein